MMLMDRAEIKKYEMKVLNDVIELSTHSDVTHYVSLNLYLCLKSEIKNGLRQLFQITDDPFDEELHRLLKKSQFNYYIADNLEELLVSYIYLNSAKQLFSKEVLVLFDLDNKEYILLETGYINIMDLLLAV